MPSAMQPLVPAENAEEKVDDLQPGVRVELRLPENPEVHHHADDARRPAPDVLARGEPDAHQRDHGGHRFECAHCVKCSVRVAFRVACG